jgi:hypothetical protein
MYGPFDEVTVLAGMGGYEPSIVGGDRMRIKSNNAMPKREMRAGSRMHSDFHLFLAVFNLERLRIPDSFMSALSIAIQELRRMYHVSSPLAMVFERDGGSG